MVWFEVFIPAKDAGLPNITLTVEAANWIGALRTGLSNLGEGHEAIANVMCDIKEDNSIHVTDVSTRRVFRLREVPAPSAPPPQATPSTSLAPEATVPMKPAPGPQPAGRATTQPPRPISMPDGAPIPPPSARPSGRPSAMPSIPVDDAATVPNMAAPTMPTEAEHSIPWTKMAPPNEGVSPTIELRATMPAPARRPAELPPLAPSVSAPVTRPVAAPPPSAPQKQAPPAPPESQPGFDIPPTANELPKKKATQAPTEATERVARAPSAATAATPASTKQRSGPVPAPTARGAPAPKRQSGQFEGSPRPVTREVSMPVPTQPPTDVIGRSQEIVNPQAIADAVADVFDATQDLLMEESVKPRDIAEKLLDIALQHVPAESGSFYLADVNGHELNFAAVRGPKAAEIQKKKLSVPVGQGIVGFCALEGVCLSVSDIQKDPRYFSAVADAVGYSPRDTICASAEKDGRLFGAVQLINSRGGFTAVHMEVLRYIGLTAASLLERHFDTQ